MKKIGLQAIACLLCICGCEKASHEIPQPEGSLIPVQFTIDLQQEVLPFPLTRAMPPLDIPEPKITDKDNGEEPASDELYDRIEYIVYHADDPENPLKHRQFTPDDPDFSIIYDSLPPGDYHLCFLAHSDKGIEISGHTARFRKVSDAFHLFLSQTIHAEERINKDIVLNRIVGKIEFRSTDTIPPNQERFRIEVSGYQDQIDLHTGEGIAEESSYIQTDTFAPTDRGKKPYTHSFFTFIPQAGGKLSASLAAYDTDNEITREREVEDISPIANRMIRYTGILYTPKVSDDTFTLDILDAGRWEEPIEKPLKE